MDIPENSLEFSNHAVLRDGTSLIRHDACNIRKGVSHKRVVHKDTTSPLGPQQLAHGEAQLLHGLRHYHIDVDCVVDNNCLEGHLDCVSICHVLGQEWEIENIHGRAQIVLSHNSSRLL